MLARLAYARRLRAGSWAAAEVRARRASTVTSGPTSPLISRAALASPPPVAASTPESEEAEDDFPIVDPHPTTAAAAATFPGLLQPRVLIYDGVCHLCHRGVKWVISIDKHEKIKFCCLQSKAAEPYLWLCGVDREDVLRRVLFVEGPESYYEGSTAALKVASYLPFPYSALSALMVFPAPLRDLVYDYVAKHRYDWFGKDDECIVMRDKELLQRFIDRDEMIGCQEDNNSV